LNTLKDIILKYNSAVKVAETKYFACDSKIHTLSNRNINVNWRRWICI